MSNDHRRIYGPMYTVGRDNTRSDLARAIAQNKGWKRDRVGRVWAGGQLVADSIGEFGDLVDRAGWLVRGAVPERPQFVDWRGIPSNSNEAARRLLER